MSIESKRPRYGRDSSADEFDFASASLEGKVIHLSGLDSDSQASILRVFSPEEKLTILERMPFDTMRCSTLF